MFARISTRQDKDQSKQKEPQKVPEAVVSPALVVDQGLVSSGNDEDINSRLAPAHTELKMHLHQRLLDMINLSVIDKMPKEVFRKEVGEIVRELLLEENKPLNLAEQARLVDDILDEVVGLGPLEPLLKDHSVTDVLVNGYSQVFVERGGRLSLTPVHFKDDRHLLRIIDKIVSAVGRRVDESSPMVDARLADGSRVNAIIPPLAVDGPLLSIRKFAKIPIDLGKLIQIGSLPEKVGQILQGVIRARLNVLISGGTGSGKTTMLNALSAFIDGRERIITIEDAAELQLQQIHVARLETRPANVEGRGEIAQRGSATAQIECSPQQARKHDRRHIDETDGAELHQQAEPEAKRAKGGTHGCHAQPLTKRQRGRARVGDQPAEPRQGKRHRERPEGMGQCLLGEVDLHRGEPEHHRAH